MAERRSPPVLPHDRVINRLARFAVPHNRGLALVGDAYAGNIAWPQLQLAQRLDCGGELRSQDRERIMLDPSRFRKELRKFVLCLCGNIPIGVEENGSRTGGTLV